MNVMMLLEMANSAFPDRIAFTNGATGETLSYSQLFSKAGKRAREIRASDSNRFVKLDVSSLVTPLSLFASGWAGIPYVPLNYRLTDEEIMRLIERVKPATLVTSEDRINSFQNLEGLEVLDSSDLLSQGGKGESLENDWDMDPEEIAVLLFTSGTTGEPKAAMLRHKHLVSYILGSVEFASADEKEASLVCVPPYHIAGIAAILSSVYSGRHVVQLPNFSAEEWIRLVRKHQVTNAMVVPTMLKRIVECLEETGATNAEMPHLASLAYGGGKMPLPVIEKAMALFPDTDFSNAYGLTETSSTISVLGPEDHRDAVAASDELLRRRLVSVGRALPGVEIQIRDDEGEEVAPNTRGEIYVRGEQVSGEYEGRGSVVDSDGWFPTRDAGSLDEDGFLFLEGRADDVIVRGGENLSPGEIEDVLMTHEAVSDVAVIGIADEQWGESVAAVIVLKPGFQVSEADFQSFVRERMRSSRVPEKIEFWTELPYNETGKLLRRVVREKLG